MSLLSPQLQAFLTIVECNTVHAAADRLALTQTAVTQRLKLLEEKLATTLFVRTRRGMVLTQEGEALLRYCHAANALEGQTLAQMVNSGVTTEVTMTIAAPTSMMRTRVIPACMPMMDTYSNLLLNFLTTDVEERHLLLRSGKCDMAIMQSQDASKEMQVKALKPEKYVMVCCPQWKGRTLKSVIQNERIVDFNHQDEVTLDYLKQFGLYDLALHGRHTVNQTHILAQIVGQGVGYTTLPKEFAMPYVKRGELILMNESKSLATEHVLAYYDRPQAPQYFLDIIQALH